MAAISDSKVMGVSVTPCLFVDSAPGLAIQFVPSPGLTSKFSINKMCRNIKK